MKALLLFVGWACFAQQADYVTQVKRKPVIDAREYLFTRTNGAGASGDLSSSGAGKVVTLTPCPRGSTTSPSAWSVYVSGGTGTAEAAQVTASTCSSGAASGTITLTTANTHAGAWSISSAGAGIQEACQANPGGVIAPPATRSTTYATISIKTCSISGYAQSVSIISGDFNAPLIQVDTSDGDHYYQTFEDFMLEGVNAGTSVVGIKITGSGNFYRGAVRRVQFRGAYTGLEFAGSGMCDWTEIVDNIFDNYAGNNNFYGIKRSTGGTGVIVAHNRFLLNTGGTGVYYRHTAVGDMVINSNHIDGPGATGIYLECIAVCTYTEGLVAIGNKIDGVTQPIDLRNIDHGVFAFNRYVGSASSPVSADAASTGNLIDFNQRGGSILFGSNATINAGVYAGQTSSNNISMIWQYNATPANGVGLLSTFSNSNPLQIQGSEVRLDGSGSLGVTVPSDGGLKWDSGSEPSCDASHRGTLWYVAGGAGVLDTFRICRKDAANAYAWVTLF